MIYEATASIEKHRADILNTAAHASGMLPQLTQQEAPQQAPAPPMLDLMAPAVSSEPLQSQQAPLAPDLTSGGLADLFAPSAPTSESTAAPPVLDMFGSGQNLSQQQQQPHLPQQQQQ